MLLQSLVDGSIRHKFSGGKVEMRPQNGEVVQAVEVQLKEDLVEEDPIGGEVGMGVWEAFRLEK